ncbi:membrane lipoprotein lipid attachment site-containing protein [Streptomyces sp. NPDC052721]|uniref:membrane lipoprotein lipid attachment site-containing protein n=1 Tax=Streptomyces sp. NPDC052721 TaxID=3154955 RepID=UPI003446F3F8
MRRIVMALGAVAALTGCAPDGPCTLADMESGVAVLWRPADFGRQRDAVTVRLCVDGSCAEGPSGDPGDPFRSLSVRLPDDVGAGPLPVRLTVTSRKDGRVVVRDSRRARLAEEHPNGRSCPPTAWTAAFRAHPEKGLTPTKGMDLRKTPGMSRERRGGGPSGG